MSSFELLELFGVTVEEPEGELRTVRIHGDEPGRVRAMRIYPDDAERLIRIEFAPEDGALADALRNGERPEWKEAVCQAANSGAVLRVAYVPNFDGDLYGERFFYPVEKRREFAEEQKLFEDERRRLRGEGLDDGSGMADMWTLKEVS